MCTFVEQEEFSEEEYGIILVGDELNDIVMPESEDDDVEGNSEGEYE